jgi:hypothetical protein
VSTINVAQAALSQGSATVIGMGHRLGHSRVSTTDQQPNLRIDALERADCYRALAENASDGVALEQVLDHLGGGDILGGVGTRLAESVAAPPG